MTQLIGLHGKAGAGKDTAFSFAQEWADERGALAVRRGFADKLKHSALTALGFILESSDALVLADGLKSLGEITTCIPDQSVLYTISGRKFLQLYGTESHRDFFGNDFWVDALLPTGDADQRARHDEFMPDHWPYWADKGGWPIDTDYAIVTDVRFENEARRILDLGGVVWEIHRDAVDRGDTHQSEQTLPVDLINKTIYNGSTLEALRTEVYVAMDELTQSGGKSQ